ncbi:ABC transporter substrate-binding protein [Roseibium salinum]|nr:ABC transporter substrate-binding protein [Roseibium salinum]
MEERQRLVAGSQPERHRRRAAGGCSKNADVRKALSIAVDRELLNELAFSGLGEPRSTSPVSGSPYYSEELEAHWTDYDPEAANALLDSAGLGERDGDGYRLRPDGKRLQLVVETDQDAYANLLELLADNYRDVGIELLPRVIDRTQWDDNREKQQFRGSAHPVRPSDGHSCRPAPHDGRKQLRRPVLHLARNRGVNPAWSRRPITRSARSGPAGERLPSPRRVKKPMRPPTK